MKGEYRVTENLLPIRTKRLWQLRLCLAGVIPIAVFSALTAVSVLFLLGSVLTFAALAVLVIWYIPAYFKSYDISFPNGAVVIKRGVIIKTCHIMPFSRLIYVQSFSTPLAKTMGLAAVRLKAARGSVTVPELKYGDVELFISSVTKESEK